MTNMRFLTPVTDTDYPFMSYRLNEPESDYVTIELGQPISNDAARGLQTIDCTCGEGNLVGLAHCDGCAKHYDI